MPATIISPPDVRAIVAPILPSLPGAAVATQPAEALLPLLSPILRQRVQLLSSSSTEPWIRLLSYDTGDAARLAELARTDRFEPHPVSGEVEVDWDSAVTIRYRRLDQETLQALVVLDDLDIFFRLVYCTGDAQGGGDGWRVGEVSVVNRPDPFVSFCGVTSIAEAERTFEEGRSAATAAGASRTNGVVGDTRKVEFPVEDDEDDDDDYWARYDATPARTPAMKRSPAPMSAQSSQQVNYTSSANANTEAEDAYYAQYDSVQPAMDNHDPDEEASLAENGIVPAAPPPLGLGKQPAAKSGDETQSIETNGSWTLAGVVDDDKILHPRPESAASSSGSSMVAKLEESAERREKSEFGVKQHVSRTIRSLFHLAQASGIDRDEFDRMVKTELELLRLIDEE